MDISLATCSQNYNIHGRYLRIETWAGERKKAIIIPEGSYNKGWGEIAGKLLQFLGEALNYKYKEIKDLGRKSFLAAAEISKWPSQQEDGEFSSENSKFLAKCLVGCFNDSFHSNLNPEVIQQWFTKIWQVMAGLRITPLAHNQFLFELPSRQEAARVKAGDWF